MGVIFYRKLVNRQTKDDRKLICHVKSFPAIYDTHHPSYNNRSERERIWESIALNLQKSAKACDERWTISAKMCEERWNKLVEMYKMTNSIKLHTALYEMIDEFLNTHCETADLSADYFEEQIDFDGVLALEMIDETYAPPPSDIDKFESSPRSYSEYSDDFCEIEDVEFYS